MSLVIAVMDYRLEFCPTLLCVYNEGEVTGEYTSNINSCDQIGNDGMVGVCSTCGGEEILV